MGKGKILIVEDDQFTRDVYREALVGEGYEVEAAEDGVVGLRLAKQGSYRLILLDLMLPVVGGIELLRELQKDPPASPNGPILILTNLMQDEVIAEGISLGARGYFIKSDNTPDKLVAEVKRLVG